MAKFEKFDPQKLIRGLAEAARQVLAEELIRYGRMPSLDQVVVAVEETRQKYRPRILVARQKESDASNRGREESQRVN